MIRQLRIIIFVLCGALLAPMISAQANPVYNVVDHPIPVPGKKLSAGDIRKNIILGGLRRSWRFDEIAPGELKATQGNPGHQAILSIKYTDAAYSITLLETTGMDQKGDQVSFQYNLWIRNLVLDIDNQLKKASTDAS